MFDFTLLSAIVIILLSITYQLKTARKAGVWICMGIFFLLFWLRADTIGNDTQEYIRIYQAIGHGDYDFASSRYEPGYLALNYILNLISDSPRLLFFVCGAFIYISIGNFIIKYCRLPELAVILFLTYGFFSFSMTAIRQALAIAILTYSYPCILHRKFWNFLIFLSIAFMFHTTAILFIFAYWAAKIRATKKNVLAILGLSLGGYFVFSTILSEMLSIFTLYEHYEGGKYFGETRIASVLYFIISLSILTVSMIILKHRYNCGNKVLNSQIIFVALAAGIYLLSMKLNILDRIAIYYNIYAILLLPNAVKSLAKMSKLGISIAITILFLSYSLSLLAFRPDWNSIFPYHFDANI